MAETNGKDIEKKSKIAGVSLAIAIAYFTALVLRWGVELHLVTILFLLFKSPLSLFKVGSIVQMVLISGVCIAMYTLVDLWANNRISNIQMALCLAVIAAENIYLLHGKSIWALRKEEIHSITISSLIIWGIMLYVCAEEDYLLGNRGQKEKKGGLIEYIMHRKDRRTHTLICIGLALSTWISIGAQDTKMLVIKAIIENTFIFMLGFSIMYFMYYAYFYNIKYFSRDISILDSSNSIYNVYNLIILSNYLKKMDNIKSRDSIGRTGKINDIRGRDTNSLSTTKAEKNSEIIFSAILDMILSIQEIFYVVIENQTRKKMLVQKKRAPDLKILQKGEAAINFMEWNLLYKAVKTVWLYLFCRSMCYIAEKRVNSINPVIDAHIRHNTGFTTKQKRTLLETLKRVLVETGKIVEVDVTEIEDRLKMWVSRIENSG